MYSKTTIQVALLVAIRGLLSPTIAVAVLLAVTKALGVKFSGPYIALALVAALLCWIAIGRDQQYLRPVPRSSLAAAGQTAVEWLAVVGTLLLIGYATKTSESFSRRVLFLWFAITPGLIFAAQSSLNVWVRGILASSRNARKAVIVGNSLMSRRLAKAIDERPHLGLQLVGVLETEDRSTPGGASGHGASVRAICDYVNQRGIDVVFVAGASADERVRRLLDELRDTTSSVYLVPDISVCDLIQARTDEIEGVPVIALCESPFQGARGLSKRATDVLFAAVLLACALPAMLVIAAAIKLSSPGRVIFRQHRYGLDGERITVLKFRTMIVCENGDRVPQATRGDARVTKLGKLLRRTSLDELPQLINVLRGTMSLVGPRPHAVAHNEKYRKLISGYMVRHKVVPGITGLAQVNGCRGETSDLEDMKRRVEYDLQYLRQWCWLLDLKIILKTAVLLVRDKHAY